MPPTPRARRWVEAEVGSGSKVTGVRRLGGGTSSGVHAIDVLLSGGSTVQFVLRRHLLFSWLQEEPDLAEKEARNLQLLERSGVAAPRLVAVDADGATCDVPAVLMTRIPGRRLLKPRNLDRWLRRMAELLPPIHAIDPGSTSVQEWRIWDDLRDTKPPEWSAHPDVWERLIQVVRRPWPKYSKRFVHRDFQHYNVLWQRGQPVALDWINASMGPVELDYGHFRHNLVVDFGFEVAERFHRHYREVVRVEPDPFWEALNLDPEWARTKIQRREMDSYARSLLAKLS